jgi:hypothetical protein
VSPLTNKEVKEIHWWDRDGSKRTFGKYLGFFEKAARAMEQNHKIFTGSIFKNLESALSLLISLFMRVSLSPSVLSSLYLTNDLSHGRRLLSRLHATIRPILVWSSLRRHLSL